jgi:hypothetical protein
MISRKRFRLSLYKLMLLKNLVENKVHKEKMQMLYAFEQMIINTEDEGEPDYYDDAYGDEEYPDERGPSKYMNEEGRILEDSKEDDEDEDCYDDEEGDIDDRDAATMAALEYYKRHKMFPPMQRIPVEAEYMSNPSDVIDEEEFEESVNDPSSPEKKAIKMQKLAEIIGNANKGEIKPVVIPTSNANQAKSVT